MLRTRTLPERRPHRPCTQGKLEQQFSGADEGGLRRNTQMIASKAEAMDIEVTLGALEAFYQENDPSKLSNVDEIYEKYPAYKVRRPARPWRPTAACAGDSPLRASSAPDARQALRCRRQPHPPHH